MEKIDPVSIRLGNNTVQLADNRVTVDTWIGNKSFRLSYLVMPLPTGIDSIIGMTFFIDHDIWLNPKRKQLIVPDPVKNTHHVLSSCAVIGEDDTHLIRQAHLTDGATQSHLRRPDKVDPSSHDKRNATPHGLAWISQDKQMEAYNVSGKQMNYLLFLMGKNRLTHEVFEKFIASGCTKLKGVDVAESSPDDSSGVEYVVNRGGRAAVQTLLSLETLTHESANAEAA